MVDFKKKLKSIQFLRGNIISLMIVLLLVIPTPSHATHSAGADISYKCLGGLQYEVTVTFYRDCGGIGEPASIQVSCKSYLGSYNFFATAYKIPLTGEEISLPCSTAVTTCNGGIITGLRKFVYKAIVILPAAETDWVFSYSLCCRNCSITTINNPCANTSLLYVEATLNNILAICNNSPVCSNIPITFVCIGQNFHYNQGVLDEDGDSLSYSLITPRINASSYVSYIAPHNTNNPILSSTPFILDPVTGDISFTSLQSEIGILTILVNEYRNGQLIGSVIRDMQIYTRACQNNLPFASGINGATNHNLTVCPGQLVSFAINTGDIDSLQTVSLTTNQGISNATYTVSNNITPTLTFCWTPSINDVSSSPKTFTVTVSDNACPTNGAQTFSYNIFVHGANINVVTTDVSCNGLSDGTASAVSLPGNNFYYLWSNGATTQGITGLPAGNYYVTATDSLGCSASSVFTISQPLPLEVSVVSTSQIKCFSDTTGNIEISTVGGSPPYNYSWSNGWSSANLNGIIAGMYTLTVTDIHQCSTSLSSTVEQPNAPLSNTFIVNNVMCFGDSIGSIQTQVSGGVEPYYYTWSNGFTSAFLEKLSSGNYNLLVVDSNGCTYKDTITVSQPDSALKTNVLVHNITCYGENNGSIDLKVTGGTPGYNYQWNTGSGNQDISNLGVGNYEVVITDTNGCTAVDNATIIQPSEAITVIAQKNNCSCNGANDGSIDLTINGGTPDYSILWNDGSSASSRNNLSSGNYTVTITDMNECIAISVLQITEPVPIQSTLIATHANCFLSQLGSITLTVAGGTEPYKYLWSNGAATQNLTNLSAGNYSVTITDENECIINAFTIINDSALTPIAITGDSILCVGDKTTLSTPYNSGVLYQWYFNGEILIGATSNTFVTPAGGAYKLVATTQCGSSISNSIEVTVHSSDIISISNNFLICPGESVQLLAGGGVDYLWTPQHGLSNINISNPVASPDRTTNYTVVVHDEYGCTTSASVQVVVVCDTLEVPNGFSPNGDGINDYYIIDGISHYPGNVFFVYNRWGSLVYKKADYDNSWEGISNIKGIGFGKELPNGTYFFILDLNNNTKPVNSYLLLRR